VIQRARSRLGGVGGWIEEIPSRKDFKDPWMAMGNHVLRPVTPTSGHLLHPSLGI
jgi:hypothetical protein